jgi:hypothetical protein
MAGEKVVMTGSEDYGIGHFDIQDINTWNTSSFELCPVVFIVFCKQRRAASCICENRRIINSTLSLSTLLAGRSLDLARCALGSLLALNALSLSLCLSRGRLCLLSLLLALCGGLLLLSFFDSGATGSGAGFWSHGSTLLDDVKGCTNDGTLLLDSAAGALLGYFL